jgi:hypothetical protein
VSLFLGVGHGEPEEALPTMRSAHVLRAEQNRRKAVTHALYVAGDVVEADAQMSGDVLAEDAARGALGGDAGELGPEPARICGAELLAGRRAGLARVAAHDEIHCATPRSSVEGSEVSPERSRIEGSVFHARSQNAGSRDFSFHVADRASAWHCESQTEVKTSGASAEGDGGAMSHTI